MGGVVTAFIYDTDLIQLYQTGVQSSIIKARSLTRMWRISNNIQIYDVTSKEVERMQTMVRKDILNTRFLFIDQLKFHKINQADKTERQLAFSRTFHQSKIKKFPTNGGLEN